MMPPISKDVFSIKVSRIFCVARIPEPVLLSMTTDKTPLSLKLADKCHIGMSDEKYGY